MPSDDHKVGLKHPGLMLKYSTFKNLATMAALREDLETAMEFYLEVKQMKLCLFNTLLCILILGLSLMLCATKCVILMNTVVSVHSIFCSALFVGSYFGFH